MYVNRSKVFKFVNLWHEDYEGKIQYFNNLNN
jgi:hypothetical protein